MIKKLFFACLFIAAATCTFAQKSRVYIASDFTTINHSMSMDLYVSVGPNFEIKATGNQDDIERIIIEKKGNALIIKAKKTLGGYNGNSCKIFIALPKLEGLSVSGSGDIYTKNTIVGDNINLAVAGSGSINVESISTKKVDATIAGSGDISIVEKSFADQVSLNIAGSGGIDAKEISAKNADLNIAGSGSIDCYASESVKANIVGSGNIICHGNPRNVEKSRMGSGNISIRD